jgi:lysophospholipase L1-like esterase
MMMRLFLVAIGLVLATPTLLPATIQVRDQLVWGDQTYRIEQSPMARYWRPRDDAADPRPPMPAFQLQHTANWKGYEASWEIRDKKLYLKELTGKIDGKLMRNREILGEPFPRHADWFTGRIYVHLGQHDKQTARRKRGIEFRIRDGEVIETVNHDPLPKIPWAWNGVQSRDFPLRAKRIVFLGDSITHAGHFVSLIEARLRMSEQEVPELINLGLPSETCSGLSEPDHPFPRPNVHERIDRALEKLKPDLVVACYGMNDGIYYPPDAQRFAAYQQGINQIIDKVSAAGAKLILMTPPAFDALPLRQKGKLLPAGAEKYSWNQIYEDYDEVLRQYAKWLMKQDLRVDAVIDLHTPVTQYVNAKRADDPDFTMSPDGVHVNQEGHQVLAKAILAAWGVQPRPIDDGLLALVSKRQKLMHDAWLHEVGHQRPGVKAGLPIDQAIQNAADWTKQIDALAQQHRAAIQQESDDPK